MQAIDKDKSQPLLTVKGLSVAFGQAEVVHDLDFTLYPGKTLAIVGESGSGKSMTSHALMGLIPSMGGRIAAGQMIWHDGRDLAQMPERELRAMRGPELAMIFQEPMTALNPVFKVGDQITETILEHRGGSRAAARAEAQALLEKVRLPDAAQMLDRYPHQLSGGMRQRVVIAMALSCRPKVLIADEPTTALDVTVQAQIMELIRDLQRETGVAVVFITHDMGVVAELADDVMVMFRGRKVEEGPVRQLFAAPVQDYTKMLLAAVPHLGSLSDSDLPLRQPVMSLQNGEVITTGTLAVQDTVPPNAQPLLHIDRACARFDVRHNFFGRPTHRIHAAEYVSLELRPGETLAIVGESGSGKSTLGRLAQGLIRPSEGAVYYRGKSYADMRPQERHQLRQKVHSVYQDPMASLNPRMTVGASIAEPMEIHGLARDAATRKARVGQLLERVGLKAEDATRFPHQFSGGQRQRICIARALAAEAEIMVADEAVSALDASIRSQMVRLLMDLQAETGLSCLFISHDMAVVEQMAHRVAVVYLGQIVEIGPRRAVIGAPRHPYTQKLIASVPVPDPAQSRRRNLPTGDVPSPMRAYNNPPERLALRRVGPDHFVADAS